MKKKVALLIGLSLVCGTAAFAFAPDDAPSTSKSKKSSKKKKGKDEATKKGS